MAELSKHYDPTQLETKWYSVWEADGYFTADPARPGEPFSIVIPPPNITGRLHMGHALNNTLQDVLTRWKRMCGCNTLWLPGTDHASIATHQVVEKQLQEEGLDRRRIGREAFLARVHKWRDETGGVILRQLRRMGCSCDWTRTRFTLDPDLSRAVRLVFKLLYDEGLIYRGSYLINWCPKDQTALSDDEVEYEEVRGHLWHIRYPLADGSGHVTVATTRPETMLGDTAVAFHPDDPRYQALKGKTCVLPLLRREIPFIADEAVEREFGTGMVKVTPAHDPNDYEMGKRHGLPMVNILNPDGTINENGGPYRGLDRFEARKRVVADLQAQGLLEKIEDHVHQVGHSYRSGAVIEPYISEQWFVSMKPLAEPAIRAVEEGRIRFAPKSWENTYFHWMRNVRDWCISRQLWYGHQIPVWYCDACGHKTVSAEETVARCEKCASTSVRQDPDMLDTWFSSALWPFSTMGWPEKTADLQRYYPTNVLVTAHEIIFFWVARMIMMGLKFMGDVPFRDVYIHSMVFDTKTRKKMSKSLGNIIDPLDMIARVGADAMRMTVCAYAVQGASFYLDEERFQGYQNFMNKFWNAARFVLMNVDDLAPEELARGIDESALEREDRWILSAFGRAVAKADAALAAYEFDQYVHHTYHFIWNEYCDWYLELVKPRLHRAGGRRLETGGGSVECGIRVDEQQTALPSGPEAQDSKLKAQGSGLPPTAHSLQPAASSRRNAQIILVSLLEGLARLLHPAAPFITEEIRQIVREKFRTGAAGQNPAVRALESASIMTAPWPRPEEYGPPRPDDEAAMERVMQAIGAVRRVRSEMSVPPGETVEVRISSDDAEELALLRSHAHHFRALARTADPVFSDRAEKTAAGGFSSTAVSGSATISVSLPASLVRAERDRLAKELDKIETLLDRTKKKLTNPEFVARAPEKVVAAERERLEQAGQQAAVLRSKLGEIDQTLSR